MLKSWLLRWHRSLAIVAVIPILAWSLTGLLHPVMSRWQPSAIAMKPPADLFAAPVGTTWSDFPAPAKTLPAGMQLRELRALTWQNQPYWVLQTSTGERRYFNARNGKPAAIEPAIIEALARHYTGVTTPISSVREVRQFDDEYVFVNRYLPVWRVAFDQPDGLVAFIEPRSLQLTGLSDTWKTRFSVLFANLHSWQWWPHEPSRDWAMVFFLSLSALVVISGLVRANSLPVRQETVVTRRWHRKLGWVVAAAALVWISSAAFHVLVINKARPSFATYPLAHSFVSAELESPVPKSELQSARIQMVATADGPIWRESMVGPMKSTSESSIAASHHQHGHQKMPQLLESWVSARTGERTTPERYLRELTKEVTGGSAPLSVSTLTQFSTEYGFVQKRLPVYQMQFENDVTIYLDPADSAVASVVSNLDRAEGFSFAYLHKGHWFDFIGKTARDAVLAAFALMIFLTACFGVSLLRRTKSSL